MLGDFMANHVLNMYLSICGFHKQLTLPKYEIDETNVVILQPDDGQLSEEEEIDGNNDTLPADVAGQIEV